MESTLFQDWVFRTNCLLILKAHEVPRYLAMIGDEHMAKCIHGPTFELISYGYKFQCGLKMVSMKTQNL